MLVAERALEASRLKREVRDLRSRSVQATRIAGKSVVINQLRQAVERASPTNARILVTGAPGSGKELTARTIHGLSTRASGPFVVVSAATITPENMEAELFGIGSGEDGKGRRVGALEEAHGGTLYIDEIADMPRETQSRILRVLVDQNFQRVGGTTRVHVDVRIISSSSRDLPAEIAAGRFREDLFHRLGVVPIRVPSLSERREDVPELIEFFMDQISATTGLPKRRIGEDAMAVLQSHDWPGNVRQLRNNVERLMILTSGEPDAPSHRRHAALRDRHAGAVDARRGRGRKTHEPAASGCSRDLRARVSSGADRPIQRKHLAHCGVHRHGALGAAPQAQVPGDRRLECDDPRKICNASRDNF